MLHLDVLLTFYAVHSPNHARFIIPEDSRASQPSVQFGENTPPSDDGLGALSQGPVLGLGRTQRNASPFPGTPVEHPAIENKYEFARGAAVRAIESPVRVGERDHLHLLRPLPVYDAN